MTRTMEKILLEGIRLAINVGVTDDERSQPQPCCLDVVLQTNLQRAGISGNLRDSVDYAAVFETIESTCVKGSFVLLEEVAHQLCHKILERYPVESVHLKIRKLKPFTEKLDSVGIEFERKRLPREV